MKNYNIYIHDIELKKVYRLLISNNKTIKDLKYLIKIKLKRDNIKIKNIKLRYLLSELKEKEKIIDTKLVNNSTIFVKYTKLKGGGDIKLVYGMVSVPNTALIINLILLVFGCPIQYFSLIFGTNTASRINSMKYSTSILSGFNNYKMREAYDNECKKDLKEDKYPIFKYKVLKSKLFMMFAILYFIFGCFFSNLFTLSIFIENYSKISPNSKCFLYTDSKSILYIGFLILAIIPAIIIFLNLFGLQFGIFIYMVVLLGGNAALLTSIYYQQYQNYDTAIPFRDKTKLPDGNDLIPEYTYTPSTINLMPSYFWMLYIGPIISLVIIVIAYFSGVKHSVVWGIACSFLCCIPLFFIISEQLPLYCVQTPFCSRNQESLMNLINNGIEGKSFTVPFTAESINNDDYTSDQSSEDLCFTMQGATGPQCNL